MICPVLDAGMTERTLLIQKGDWINVWTGYKINSRRETVPTLCSGMPIYVRASNSKLLEQLKTVFVEIIRGIIKLGITTATHQCGLERDLSVSG